MDVEKLSVDGFNLNISDAKARDMISDKYDPDNGTYVVGDTCINDDVFYICNTDIDIPEDFDSSKWDADTIGHYCSELKSNLIELQYTDIGTSISLTANTDYLTLSDGYFTLTFNGGDVSGNHYAYGSINGVRVLSLNSPKTVATYGYECDSVFVRKGSTIKFEGDSLARGAFRPLVAPTP